MSPYLCDTSILIEYLRGNATIKQRLERDGFDALSMSSITVMELFVGAFNKRELASIKKAFRDIRIIDIDNSISRRATELIELFSKSHNLLIPDALIAATALVSDVPLYTLNVSDFRFIPGIRLVDTDSASA